MANKCIMFADIAGSTAMYEKYGNAMAEKSISSALKYFSTIITESGGVIVKYIGDEVLTYFEDSANAVEAAIKIQELCERGIVGLDIPINVRIGLDYGDVIHSEDKDIFGDAVNTAARMVGYAKAGQIITNGNVIDVLPPDLRAITRQFDKTKVKGKADFLGIFRINWEQENDDVTRIATETDYVDDDNEITVRRESTLNLVYCGKSHVYADEGAEFRIGRDPASDIVVIGTLASRKHGLIALQREKFVYYDSSTNGSTISIDEGGTFFLRRENMALYGKGLICLGDTISSDKELNPNDVIQYELITSSS
ncbi:MAG: adenylate/guanylate cyclase domain-containing protein [Gammaproteobacteria bacterium]|nr:adenylate/guanylate cyclase domain-containing protein [Gammaproteobacteria bacterium]